MTALHFIQQLQLQAHPEGGFYKETYRANEQVSGECLPERFNASRSFSTAIYYLLQAGYFSSFHRIKSDECWHFYNGGTLLIHAITIDGVYNIIRLGKKIIEGETFQFVVPAGTWFAAEPAPDTPFSLVGCTVAPGFDFNDFEMAEKEQLLKQYPGYKNVIERLCR